MAKSPEYLNVGQGNKKVEKYELPTMFSAFFPMHVLMIYFSRKPGYMP